MPKNTNKSVVIPRETRGGNLVRKSNDIVRAPWPIKSIWELRIINLVAAQVRKEDKDFKIYKIPASDVIGLEAGGRTYRELAKSVKNLLGRVIFEPNDDGGWTECTLFSRCRYRPKEGSLELRFDPEVKTHLLGLKKHFTKFSLVEFLMLPSIYSQRLFEILHSWHSMPEVLIPLDELHEMLDTPASLRKRYPDFRRKVLEKTHTDITTHTTFQYRWEPIKKGRSVRFIRFDFRKKHKNEQKVSSPNVTTTNGSNDSNVLARAAIICHEKGKCTFDARSSKCAACKKMYG
jgi:plasmid replication initiation protein